MQVVVIGAGVAGLSCALELAESGAEVRVVDHGSAAGEDSCSWFAGGMLAPWCEGEDAEPLITEMGRASLAWWRDRAPDAFFPRGTLVVAQERDREELARFARRTEGFEAVDQAGVGELEPDLAGRFTAGLYFVEEAHLEPRAALAALRQLLARRGVSVEGNVSTAVVSKPADCFVDCRGMGAKEALRDLRGVKGEMVVLRTDDVQLTRPVRLLHPRIPLYVVPRGQGLYMIGATMIESDDRRVTTRSVVELLNAAYALHPGFAEAEVVELGAAARPAFPDNLPKIRSRGDTVFVNGLYRHGFLLSPALAEWTREVVLHGAFYPEVMDETARQRPTNGSQVGCAL